MVPAERTVTVGVGHGKQAARNIDAWLRGRRLRAAAEARARHLRHAEHLVLLGRAAHLQPELETARRRSTFDEVVGGLDESNALFEARRCLSCGTCFACDNCYGVCPDNAVIKLDHARPVRATRSTSTTARAAGSASRSAPRARSRWSPRRSDLTDDEL